MEKVEKNVFDFFQEHKDFIKNNHLKMECYISIDDTVGDLFDKNEYEIIANSSIEAYLKYDEHDILLQDIAIYLVNGIREDLLSFEELKELEPSKIVMGFLYETYDFNKEELSL